MFSFFKIKKPVDNNNAEQGSCGSCGCATANLASAGVDSAQAELVKTKITSVKVLGTGCKKCHELYKNAQEAVKSLGSDADVVYVTDMEKIMAYNVMSTPALVINDQVVSTGSLLSASQVSAALISFAQKQ